MQASDSHVTTSQIVTFAAGEGSEHLRRKVGRHVSDCEACRRWLARVEQTIRKHRRLSLVFNACVAVSAAFLLTTTTLLAVHAMTPAPLDLQLRDLATTSPPSQVVMDFHVRASGGRASASSAPLVGVDELAAGQYVAAVAELQAAFERAPTEMTATYLGMARYLAGDTTDTVAELLEVGDASQNESIQETAAWYLANYHLRAGAVETSLELLDRIAALPSEFGRAADELRGAIRSLLPDHE